MDTFETQISTSGASFATNAAHHRGLAEELRGRLALVRGGGGEKYRATHEERGKLGGQTR